MRAREQEDGRKISVYLGSMVDEMEQEGLRLERKTTWLLRQAWLIARKEIQQLEPSGKPTTRLALVSEPREKRVTKSVDFANAGPLGRAVHRLQEFRCIPYSMTMQAGACLANQDAVASPEATPDLKRRRAPCLNCAEGQRIRQQLTNTSEQTQEQRKAMSDTGKAMWARKREPEPAAKVAEANPQALIEDSVVHLAPPRGEGMREARPSQASTSATSKGRTPKPRCIAAGCRRPPALVRPCDNIPPDLVAMCARHRKNVKLIQWRQAKKGNPSPVPNRPRSPTPTVTALDSASFASPSTLAELHGLCVEAGRNDLALSVGIALAASVRERKAGK